MKLGDYKGRKVTEPDFGGKNRDLEIDVYLFFYNSPVQSMYSCFAFWICKMCCEMT